MQLSFTVKAHVYSCYKKRIHIIPTPREYLERWEAGLPGQTFTPLFLSELSVLQGGGKQGCWCSTLSDKTLDLLICSSSLLGTYYVPGTVTGHSGCSSESKIPALLPRTLRSSAPPTTRDQHHTPALTASTLHHRTASASPPNWEVTAAYPHSARSRGAAGSGLLSITAEASSLHHPCGGLGWSPTHYAFLSFFL